MAKDLLSLYRQYHLDRGDDRLGLFRLLAERYPLESALYPGCFVHLTPSLVFPLTTFVDSDRRAGEFFAAEAVWAYIAEYKLYPESAQVKFHPLDYREQLPEPEGRFDLLISQYAGFVSEHCTRYLKVGGLLLANNSHGDASLASLDPRYELAGVFDRRGERFSLKASNLETYLVPKSGILVTREALLASGRGVGYTRTASAYLFRRVG